VGNMNRERKEGIMKENKTGGMRKGRRKVEDK